MAFNVTNNFSGKAAGFYISAALKQAKIAIGSLSGAMVVARSCNVPVITWGLSRPE